jgi:hypothetical protein
MSAFFLLGTFLLFFTSMVLYVILMYRRRTPVSYFALRAASKEGDSWAKAVVVTWDIAIIFSICFAISVLSKFFI